MAYSSTTIDPATLSEWIGAGEPVRVLDVRTPAEFETVHIPGSYNVPLDTVGEHADEIGRHVAEPVVVVCRTGARATQGGQRLVASGTTDVHVLDGGIVAWEQHGGAVARGEPRWDLERQVRLVAGSLVLGSVVASIWARPARFLAGGVGLGLVVAALTDTCTMARVLAKLPYNRDASCDVDAVVAQLTALPDTGSHERGVA